ncbi:MAG: helix-turn-helix transcriptional regulator [Clostridia bacterium]|nr:helix-turn-helix transcriptional regulator [Clostridia bacterium]
MKNEVARLRKERRISQDALATAMGVSRQTICSIENGKYNPSILLAIHIARYFGLTVEEVFIADDISVWKTADVLRTEEKKNENYDANRRIALDDEPLTGQAVSPCDLFRYGGFSLSFNGGEAIALYNHSILSEQPVPLADIIYELEENDMALLGGFAGTDPKKLGKYFLGHGIPYKMLTKHEDFDKHIRRKCGVFIYSYFDIRNLLEIRGIHTVAGVYDELGLTVYNYHDDDIKPTSFKSAKAWGEGKSMIAAYVFDAE